MSFTSPNNLLSIFQAELLTAQGEVSKRESELSSSEAEVSRLKVELEATREQMVGAAAVAVDVEVRVGVPVWYLVRPSSMMTSSNGNIVRITGPLCGESTGNWWILLTKASDAELWCFLWSAPEQMVEKTIDMPVIWYAIALIMTSL